MKKGLCFIALVLVAVLSIPSVPCFAAEFQYRFLTSESVEDYWEQSSDNTLQSKIVRQSSTKISQDLHYFETYETQLQTFCSNYDQYLIGYAGQGTSTQALSDDFIIFGCPSDVICVYYYTSINASSWINNYCFVSDHAFSVYYNRFGQNYDLASGNLSTLNATLNNEYYVAWVSAANMMQSVVSGDCPVYSFGAYGDPFGQKIKDTWDNQASLTNYNSGQIPFIDENGDTVDPSVPDVVYESNQNHMYFQNCDLGFCEPTDIKNFTSFGGAYLYCKYTLDNWVINHINDYQLQFNVVSAIGSEQNNFTYTMRVDRNGFVTIPFSYIFQSQSSSAIPINRGFAAVVTNQKLGSDYNIAHLYSVANSNVPNFIRTLGAEYNYNLSDLGWSALKGGTLKYLCAWVSDGGTISMNNLAEWSENVAQSFNPYILRVNVKLVSGNDTSGDYAEKFDLYAGDQSTVDTGGLVNNDPFVPDVDQDDGDLPSVPEDPNSTTPSTIVYTGGTFTGNFNGVIGFDPGYRELRQDLDENENGNFTQYLDPMHNSEVGSWFMSFVNAMPSEMKAILVTGAGVGVFFGLYRFIRRG